ncbi:MAG: glutamine synthetase [Planctomycetota bacterium]|jgi:glutamine synthetase
MSTTLEPWHEIHNGMDRKDILSHMNKHGVRFLRLQFTDITGVNKNVEVPASQFEKALDGEILFDGSSIDGFCRIEESDMVLKPDYATYRLDPFPSVGLRGRDHGRVARVICDVFNPDGSPFAGCPRQALKRQCAEAAELGYEVMVGPEAEFFLFQRGPNGEATTETHDSAGYFDLAPTDLGESCRREIVLALEAMGFEIEAAHHEVAPGQHEIDFKYGPAVEVADNLSTFRYVVRRTALEMGLHATFMPKPIYLRNGSGMHCHQSLFKDGVSAFYDKDAEFDGISKTMQHYIGGLLAHARGFCAVTNPIVNSYKRLVPGYEAPTHLAWSMRNRSPLIRVPDRRGIATRCELRSPDPACNPYLAFTVMLAAGLDGVKNATEPPPPVAANVYDMSARERGRLKIKSLPSDLGDALDQLEKSSVMREALGEHIFTQFLVAKRTEWEDYIGQVHQWEVDRYLTMY